MGCGISNSKNLNQIEPEKKQKNIQKSSEALKKKEKKLHFEEYELINLQKLYEKEDSSVIVNLVAYIGDQSIPFFVQKYMENKKEYENEKLVYSGFLTTFGEGIKKNAIMMENFNDEKKEIFFSFGKSTLQELAQSCKKTNGHVPNELIALTFKVVAKMMLTFYQKGYFYTDCKPENLVFDQNEKLSLQSKQSIFDLKFIDFGGFTNQIEIESGYTPHYYTSELFFQRKQQDIDLIKFQNKEERLQNEFYTLARTIIRLLIEEEEDQKTKFEKEVSTIKKVKENNEFFLNTILQKYKEQIEKDSNYGQIVQKIFDIINRLVSSNVNFQQLLVEIKQLIKVIKIEYFVDENKFIQKIASDKIDHKQGEINPLEMLLSLNCNIELHGSRYANQPSDKKLEDMIFEYLNNENQRIYLLLGKSGSGKSLFVRKFFSKLCQISAENQNQQIKNNQESRINYQFLCKYIKLNGYGDENGKYLFGEKIKEYIDELKQDGQQLILLLDGFDEFGEEKDQILDLIGIINKENNKIEEEIMNKLKIIVSCRSTAITDNEIDTIFKIKGKELSTEVQYICAVQKEQMHEYIKRFVEIVNQYKDSKLFGKFNAFKTYEEYKQMLEGSQSLQDMATEPFTIRLLVGIMPDIRDKFGGKGQGIKITIFEILQIYVEKWIENEISRLNSDEQYILADEILDIDLNDLGKSLPEGVKKIGEQTLKLIEYLWINNQISNNNFSNEDLEKISEQFDVNEQNLKIIVKCLPIVATTKNDKISYSFFHKSILDYFLARYWLQDFLNEEDKDRIVELKNLNIIKKFIIKEQYSSLYMLADYVIETSNRFENNKDSMALYRQCVNVCIQAVNFSKQEGFKDLEGPSNAMTLLNAIGFTFSGLDLSNVKIQNANLDRGQFYGTNFKNCQISSTDFKRSNLSDSNFEKSQLKNIEIGIPKPDLLGHEGPVKSVVLSKDGKYVVSGDSYGSIKAWNYETGGEIKTFENDCCTKNSVTFSKDGKYIVVGCDNGKIKVMSTETKRYVKTLVGHSSGVISVTISSDSKYIVSGSNDKTIKIWNLESGQEIKTLNGHSNDVVSVAISSDGKYIVSGSWDKTIKIWNLESGQEIKTLNGHNDTVNSVAISSDNKYIVSGSRDNTIKIWNFESGQEIKTLTGHINCVTSVAISQDSKYIVSGSWDSAIKIWNLESGQEIKTLAGHSDIVTSVSISSDSKYIVSGSWDSAIKIWNLESGQEIKTLNGHSSYVNSVAISSDNKYMVSVNSNQTIKMWNLENGQQIPILNGHSSSVISLIISSDNKYIVSGSEDETIKIWNLESGQEIKTLTGHSKSVYSVAISSDSKYIVSGSEDKTVKIWSFESGQEIKTLSGHNDFVKSVAISSGSKYIVSGSNDKTIKIWNLESGQLIKILSGCNELVLSVAISSDSKYIVSGSEDKTVKIWNFESGQEIKTLSGHSDSVKSVAITSDNKYIVSGSQDETIKIWSLESGQEIKTLTGHSESVNSVALSSDSKYIVSGSWDKTIKIWNLEIVQEIKTLYGHSSNVESIAISSDNKFIVSVSDDNTIKIWNYENGQEIKTLKGHSYSVTSVAISSDNKYIVSGSRDNTIKIWNLESGQEIKTLAGHNGSVRSVAISSDSKYIVSGSDDNTIKIWNLESGQEIKTLNGHSSYVHSVAISPDNKYIVSVSDDGTIEIWNFENGEEIKTLNGHNGSVRSVAISLDSKFIVSGSWDKTIKIWNLESGQVIKTLNGHNGSVRSVAISQDSKYIVSGSDDKTIKLWNFESGQEIKTLTGHIKCVTSVSISSDSKYIVSGSEDNSIKIWNFESGQEIQSEIQSNGSIIIKQEQGEQILKYKINLSQGNYINVEKIESNEQNQLNNKKKLTYKQDDNKSIKKADNLIFVASSDNLKKMTIKKDKKYEYMTIQAKYPTFLCKGINLQGVIGLTKNQLRILAQRSKQELKEMIDKAEK